MFKVTWLDKKGAGCMRLFQASGDCFAFISKLRCPATVRNQDGNVIGGVYDRTKDDPFLAPDTAPKTKWIYWLE